jgi:alkenylglycerophosphocholine/alkenylglycerophosphoethanolamine hydrolase
MSTSASKLPTLLASTFLVGVCLYLVGVATDDFILRMVVKPAPVLALIAWTLWSSRDTTGKLTAVALALGLAGDVLLEASSGTFLIGLVAFLFGHIAYIVVLSRAAGRLAPLQAIPMLAYGGVMAVVLAPHLGGMAIPVIAYLLVICAMAWRAAALAEARGGIANAALIGAVLFLFSDTLLAMNRFLAPMEGIRPAIILTYWLAQAGLTVGLVKSAGQRKEAPVIAVDRYPA